jgi:hypothetical protein
VSYVLPRSLCYGPQKARPFGRDDSDTHLRFGGTPAGGQRYRGKIFEACWEFGGRERRGDAGLSVLESRATPLGWIWEFAPQEMFWGKRQRWLSHF